MAENIGGIKLFRTVETTDQTSKVILEIREEGKTPRRFDSGIRPDMTRFLFKGCALSETRRSEEGDLIVSVPTEKDAQGVLDSALKYEWSHGNDYY